MTSSKSARKMNTMIRNGQIARNAAPFAGIAVSDAEGARAQARRSRVANQKSDCGLSSPRLPLQMPVLGRPSRQGRCICCLQL